MFRDPLPVGYVTAVSCAICITEALNDSAKTKCAGHGHFQQQEKIPIAELNKLLCKIENRSAGVLGTKTRIKKIFDYQDSDARSKIDISSIKKFE